MGLRSAGILTLGIAVGILAVIGFQAVQALGWNMNGTMGSVMRQMMGPRGMAEMMTQAMGDPQSMRSMAAACAQSMKDPAVVRSMQDAMDDPKMRHMMEQMLEIMRRR